jgi:hypothetical protein
MEQIYLAFSIYKFRSIEEAIHIMMKDPETNKYLHRFLEGDKRRCQICRGKYEEHANENVEPLHANDEEESLTISEGNKPASLETGIGKGPSIEVDPSVKQDLNKSVASKRDLNLIKIDLPQEVLDDFEDPNICRICFSSKLNVDPKVTFSCQHEFCKTCVYSYLFTNIVNGNVMNIRCIYGGCPRVFTNEEVKANVDDDLWEKYRKFLVQKLKLNQPNVPMMNCPYPDCDDIVEIDPLERQIFVECDYEHKFCSKCKEVGWHEEGRCEKVSL